MDAVTEMAPRLPNLDLEALCMAVVE